MSSTGYIKIYRKIKKDDLWPDQEKRSFTRFEAWIDLILSAVGLPKTILYRDQPINLKRGEMIIARRKLAERWGWSQMRVHRFVAFLKETGKIRYHRRDHRFTIIFIVKYDTYNPLISDIKPINETTDETTDETKINKEEIKNKESNKIKPLARTQKQSEPQILFDFEKRKFLNIKEEDIEDWRKAYPACDIETELEGMKQWLLSNPNKRKKLYRRFITNWLSRSQERGGSIKSVRSPGSKISPEMRAWAEKEKP